MQGFLVDTPGWNGRVPNFNLAAYERLDYADRQQRWAAESEHKRESRAIDKELRVLEKRIISNEENRRRQAAELMKRRQGS